MRRREFITLFGGAATWPVAARAQRALPVIGFLHEGLPAPSHLTAAFGQGLVEAGINEGRGITIENRWAERSLVSLPGMGCGLNRASGRGHRCPLSLSRASRKGCDPNSTDRFR